MTAAAASRICWSVAVGLLLAGCQLPHPPGSPAPRAGDEIVAAGRFFHTGTPVVLWTDPGGYDAYRVERRFSPFDESAWETSKFRVKALTTPNRYGLRRDALSAAELERVRGGGWDLPLLQRVVDQFVLHYDGSGTSQECFRTLHDVRGLSVHFLLDLDGTIYQTLDLKERAWHATTSNSRSIGIEIANIGAYPAGQPSPLTQWYGRSADGRTRITLPPRLGDGGLRRKQAMPRPARPAPVRGEIQGRPLEQYDFTPEQYAALVKLTATLCRVFPRIRCDYPRGADGRLVPGKLDDDALREFRGVLGHFHIQSNKIDPGPAFQWDAVIEGARGQLRRRPVPERGHRPWR
ncbi:MAG TPA: N-acetylmuramoyl-L-alanine amidase [Methylomirabilota bacterium]|nr:N-acetylmuramoyl-L-alanine amidase [Methylomirabilota bacterium]